jgi:hypothetical protein
MSLMIEYLSGGGTCNCKDSFEQEPKTVDPCRLGFEPGIFLEN